MKLPAKILAYCLLVASAMAASASVMADEWLKSIPEFELKDQLGKTHTLEQYKDKDLMVFYVNGVGCPIARIALPSYREVRDQFQDKNIGFVMFNANIQDDVARIAGEAEEFGIDFPIIKDEDQLLAKSLGVERTAEVFVVNPKTQEVLYRGPINDKLGYETQRNHANEHFLRDALNTILAGGTVNIDDIPESKGCLVAIFDS